MKMKNKYKYFLKYYFFTRRILFFAALRFPVVQVLIFCSNHLFSKPLLSFLRVFRASVLTLLSLIHKTALVFSSCSLC